MVINGYIRGLLGIQLHNGLKLLVHNATTLNKFATNQAFILEDRIDRG